MRNEVADAIVQKAIEQQKAAVVAVCDGHGELLAFAHIDDTAFVNSCGSQQDRDRCSQAKTHQRHWRQDLSSEKGFDIAFYGNKRFVG